LYTVASLPSVGGRPPRPNGQSTAKIAATVISANTNHNVIKRFRLRGAHIEAPMRRFTPAAASPAIDNCSIGNWDGKGPKMLKKACAQTM
jgi:hypothetical protein